MTHALLDLLDLLHRATMPEDVFGSLPPDGRAALRRRYHELVATAHPDRNPQQVAAANEACGALRRWYELAQQRVADGTYGLTPRIEVVTHQRRYVGHAPPVHGDLCDLYPASGAGEAVLLKIARNGRNNDLLANEARTLRQLARELDGQPLRAHFPTLVESFLLRDQAGVQRQGNVLLAETGYITLADVLRAYPSGIAAADAAWMFNRLLAALGVAHDQGIVHGAVLPPHVLIRPADHNGMLIDWCYSVPSGTALLALSPPYAAHYPPEVAAKLPATPATDLYMAARCMLLLLGGQGASLEPPASVPPAVRALLRACLLPSPQRRAQDAWQLFDDFRTILLDLYGPPTFRPFAMQ